MNKPFSTFFIILGLLVTGCSSNTDPTTTTSGSTSSDPSHDYKYQCSITWDGYTPSATFSIPDGSMTSDEIALLFDEKISQKVIDYPTEETKGTREHKVKYVLKEDETFFFESSTSNEEFEFQHVDTNAPQVVNYLRAQTEQEQFDALQAGKGKDLDYNRLTLNFHKYGREQTSIYLASDAAFTTDVVKYQTAEETYDLNYLIPGETYYWKAVGKASQEEFDGGLFKVNSDNVRFANYDRVGNMRDLGGWKTSENTRIKYGMVFRGRNPDSLNPTQKDDITANYGFKTQIDLRYDADGGIGVTICPNVAYYYTNTARQYNHTLDKDRYLNEKAGILISPDEDNGERLTYAQLFQKVFKLLAKEESYPLYFHCIHGADRTGTLAYLIEGVLGVESNDLIKDYELTTFCSKSGIRTRRPVKSDNSGFADPVASYQSGTSNYEQMNLLIDSQPGSSLQEKIESYLINKVGVAAADIAAMKNLLIEQH